MIMSNATMSLTSKLNGEVSFTAVKVFSTSPTGSHQKRLDVQAGWEGNLCCGKQQNQSHHKNRGCRRLRLRVLAGGGRQESAEVHPWLGPDHQDLASQHWWAGLQGGSGWVRGPIKAKNLIRSYLRKHEVVFVDSSSLTEKDTMDVWCNGQKMETTVRNVKYKETYSLERKTLLLILLTVHLSSGRVCGGWHRNAVQSGGTWVLHQGDEHGQEKESNCSLLTAGWRESTIFNTINLINYYRDSINVKSAFTCFVFFFLFLENKEYANIFFPCERARTSNEIVNIWNVMSKLLKFQEGGNQRNKLIFLLTLLRRSGATVTRFMIYLSS